MQSEAKIRHRLKLLRFRYLEKELRKAGSRNPCNCKFNAPVRVPKSKGVAMYVCTHQENGFRETVCDDRHGGNDLAARCPLFEARKNKEEVIAEFNEFWTSASLPKFAERHPDATALLWALDEIDFRDVPFPSEEEVEQVFGKENLLNSLALGETTVQEVTDSMVVIIPCASGDPEIWTPFNGITGFFDRYKWTENG